MEARGQAPSCAAQNPMEPHLYRYQLLTSRPLSSKGTQAGALFLPRPSDCAEHSLSPGRTARCSCASCAESRTGFAAHREAFGAHSNMYHWLHFVAAAHAVYLAVGAIRWDWALCSAGALALSSCDAMSDNQCMQIGDKPTVSMLTRALDSINGTHSP
jgi:hypothetical protein